MNKNIKTMTEQIIYCGPNKISGILTSGNENGPSTKIALLLNSGMIHKVGPNRFYVELARRLCLEGVDIFRFDFSGIGDHQNSMLKISFEELSIMELHDVIQHFHSVGYSKFIIIGMCTGGDVAFKYASQYQGISSVIAINANLFPRNLIQAYRSQIVMKLRTRYYKKYLFDLSRWTKLIRGKSQILKFRNILAAIQGLFFRKFSQQNTVQDSANIEQNNQDICNYWISILQNKVKVKLIYAEGSGTLDAYNLISSPVLKKIDHDKLVNQEIIYDSDHVFMLDHSKESLTNSIVCWTKEIF